MADPEMLEEAKLIEEVSEVLRTTGIGPAHVIRTQLVNLERLSDEVLARLKQEFERLARSRATGA